MWGYTPVRTSGVLVIIINIPDTRRGVTAFNSDDGSLLKSNLVTATLHTNMHTAFSSAG